MATGRVPTTANSPLTAKGDLFTYSTAPARLAVGNSGEQIVADSSTSTGLRYTAGNPIPNPILNSSFQIAQRGTSFASSAITTVATSNTLDRWGTLRNGFATGATFSRQNTNDTTNLPNIQYCLRAARDVSNTSVAPLQVQQCFETVNSIPYAGKTATFSFYARAGANYSATSGALLASVLSGTGTDQNAYTGYTGLAAPIQATVTLTTTWQRFSVSGTIATTATELAPNFNFTPVGTAGAADYYEVTGIQLDIGSVALPFRTNGATIQGETSACQRYYYRYLGLASSQNVVGSGFANSATSAQGVISYPTTMRTAPTMSYSAIADVGFSWFAGTSSPTVVNQDLASTNSTLIRITTTGLTTGTGGYFRIETGTSKYLDFSAEL